MMKNNINNFFVDKFIKNNDYYKLQILTFDNRLFSLFQDIKRFGSAANNNDFALHTSQLKEKLKELNELRNEKQQFQINFKKEYLKQIDEISLFSDTKEMIDFSNLIKEIQENKYMNNTEEDK